MDVKQMKADLGPGAVFDIGEENTAFAQYFTGECYLKMLTTEGVPIGNVSFAPKTVNHERDIIRTNQSTPKSRGCR